MALRAPVGSTHKVCGSQAQHHDRNAEAGQHCVLTCGSWALAGLCLVALDESADVCLTLDVERKPPPWQSSMSELWFSMFIGRAASYPTICNWHGCQQLRTVQAAACVFGNRKACRR